MPACLCSCHNERRANQRAEHHLGRYMHAFEQAQKATVWEHRGEGVEDKDPVAAVWACATCLNDHCAALSGRVPLRPPREQADGYTDSYTLPEAKE
jgi:hypothetical protein